MNQIGAKFLMEGAVPENYPVGFIEPAGGDGFRRFELQFCDLDPEVREAIVAGLTAKHPQAPLVPRRKT